MAPHKKLKRISATVFQQTEIPENQSRPFEWRRSFNFINLPLKNIKILTSCNLQDSFIEWGEDDLDVPLKSSTKVNITNQLIITGLVDEKKTRDSFYFAVKDDDEGIFQVESPSGNKRVSIRIGDLCEESKNCPAGYRGGACRLDFEPGEDGIHFELSAPKEELLALVEALRIDPSSSVEVGAHLLSFTYEVDDALSEWYHPRDIVLNESTTCMLAWAQVASNIGKHTTETSSEFDSENEINDQQLDPIQNRHQELMQMLSNYELRLNKLVTAIWVLIIVLSLLLLNGI